MLETLAKHAGRLVTSKHLLHEVWGPAYGTETNYLRVYMAQLRRKLEPDPSRPVSLLTEPGMGYRLVSSNTVEASVERRPRRRRNDSRAVRLGGDQAVAMHLGARALRRPRSSATRLRRVGRAGGRSCLHPES